MTTAQREELENQVLAILRETGRPLTIPDIEARLTSQGQRSFDTFDVRNAVWQLIETQRAEFTPRRYVKAVAR
jgi:hypothetical protein